MNEECGTNQAYNRHIRRGETPDAACKAAHSARNATQQLAALRAYQRLAAMYPTDFEALYAEERRRGHGGKR